MRWTLRTWLRSSRDYAAGLAIAAATPAGMAMAQPFWQPQQPRAKVEMAAMQPRIGGQCPGCEFSGFASRYVQVMPGANLDGARFVNAKIGAFKADGASLKRANFSFAELPGAQFGGALLEGAYLVQTEAREASFAGANLSRADLSGADFANADFASAQLRNARFSNTKLAGADLSLAVGLTQGQLNAACGDGETKLPRGLTIPACAAQS